MKKKETIINNVPERGDITNITLQDIARYEFVLPYVKNKKVLDIACGTGWGTMMILSQGNATEVFGVDIDKETIDTNKKKYGEFKNQFFICSSCYNINFEDNTFDVSISIETLEHLDNPKKFLAELKRVTKPNGLIIISTPLNNSDQRFNPSNPFHIREYNEKELREMFNEYFSDFNFYYQQNLLKKNWLTRITDRILSDNSLIRKFFKSLIPNKLIRRLRKFLKADKDITLASTIKREDYNASVIIAVIKNDK